MQINSLSFVKTVKCHRVNKDNASYSSQIYKNIKNKKYI